mgnify:CR=1 FL=1
MIMRLQVPDEMREAPAKMHPDTQANDLLNSEQLKPLGEITPCNVDTVKHDVKSMFDYRCLIAGDLLLISSLPRSPELRHPSK